LAIEHVFAGVAVSDYDASAAWYERLLGRPPDLIPKAGEAAWRLSGSGWIYIVADAERAGRGLITVTVDDLDAQLAELEQREVEIADTRTVPDVVRTALVVDPDGSRIQFGQGLG
jgi:catechol 2,3-dioxygenase-like lactoylglutathione lyase family enzyme